jgi:ABC-type transport system involved in cytochrome bd biosynthesis fused ATPase/permease subunit
MNSKWKLIFYSIILAAITQAILKRLTLILTSAFASVITNTHHKQKQEKGHFQSNLNNIWSGQIKR